MQTTKDLELAKAIVARGLLSDVEYCVTKSDWEGVAFIVNMVEGFPSSRPVRINRLFDICEHLIDLA